jgi:acetoin utilization protein AcuB
MLVEKRMTRNPQTIAPDDDLAAAQAKMRKGGFRRLPVVKDEKLVGILTDRDLREHSGVLERTKVSTAMTKNLMTVAPRATFEQAAKLMLSHKISGLPVTDGGKLFGIVTTSDIVQAFLAMMGASEEGSSRLDFLLDGSHDLALASKTIAEEGGEVLGVGTYKETWEESRVCYMHVRAADPNRLADALKEKDYTVLGVHR